MPKKKWQVVESVVTALEESRKTADAKVTPNAAVPYMNNPRRTRQVDVHVSVPTGPRTLTVGIEVKSEARPLSVATVEQVQKMLSKLELDRRCLISTSGFTAAAREDSAADGLELLTMEEIKEVSWWDGPLRMGILSRQVELLHVQINWESEHISKVRELLPALPPMGQLFIVQSDDRRHRVDHLAIHHGIHALEREESWSLPHGGIYQVNVKTDEPWKSIEVDERPDIILPAPANMQCLYRLHIVEGSTDARAFSLHGRHAISASITLNEEPIEITMVGEPVGGEAVRDFRIYATRTPKKQTRVGAAAKAKTTSTKKAAKPPTAKKKKPATKKRAAKK